MTDETTDKQSRFGEPWAFRQHRGGWSYIVDKDGDQHVSKHRTVACVNALAGRDPSKLAALETALEDYIIAHEKWEADVILYDESGDPRTEPPRLTKELYEGAIVVQTKRHEAQAALAAFRGEGE